jgi:uncharacterized tellurite resistance protein B-like protein
MVFGRWSRRAAADVEGHALFDAVRAELPEVDLETAKIVTAVAGLLGGVAYADRQYSAPEEGRVRENLARVHGMTARGVDAIVKVLREHLLDIATVQAPRYCRVLREEADRDTRLEVLEMLADIAAADGEIKHEEVTLLRNTTQALGLDQADYNAVQGKHRDKLSLLR